MALKENYRELLLDAVVRVAARDGLDRTTTKLIAAEVPCNEVYIYRNFGSKDGLQRAEDEVEDLLVQFWRVLQIAAENMRDEAENRLKYVRHQKPAVMRGDEIPAESGLKLLIVAVVQFVGAGKELRGVIIAQIKPGVVRLGQAEAPHRLPQRVAALLQRLAGFVHHVQIL